MLDPFRNEHHDVEAAIEHAQESFDRFPARPCLDSPTRYFAEERVVMFTKDILSHDDYSSWGQWRPGELAAMAPIEMFDELVRFRGRGWAEMAVMWLKNAGIPAVVVIDSRYGKGIGDGRGRTSLAVGLNIPALHAIRLVDCRRR